MIVKISVEGVKYNPIAGLYLKEDKAEFNDKLETENVFRTNIVGHCERSYAK